MPLRPPSPRSLTIWLGLAVLAVFTAALGVGDPTPALAGTQDIAMASSVPLHAGGLFGLGPRPHLLVVLGLAGLLIFPDRIAPGTGIRRDPSSR